MTETTNSSKEVAYAPLLEKADDMQRMLLDPEDVLKLVKRVRRVAFFVDLGVEEVTEVVDDEQYRAYPNMGSLKVSAAQACEVLQPIASRNVRRAEDGKPVARVWVRRLGDCIFIG